MSRAGAVAYIAEGDVEVMEQRHRVPSTPVISRLGVHSSERYLGVTYSRLD
jgi:hypothetical protein